MTSATFQQHIILWEVQAICRFELFFEIDLHLYLGLLSAIIAKVGTDGCFRLEFNFNSFDGNYTFFDQAGTKCGNNIHNSLLLKCNYKLLIPGWGWAWQLSTNTAEQTIATHFQALFFEGCRILRYFTFLVFSRYLSVYKFHEEVNQAN